MNPSKPASIDIRLLGTPGVFYQEEPLSIPRRQVRALLYRLAVEQRPLSRSRLAGLFWADCPDSTARRNLSRLLVYLAAALPPGSWIDADEDQVSLSDGISTDTITFERLWEEWKVGRRIQDLQEAAELYLSPFLDGFQLSHCAEYNTWIEQQADEWEVRYLKVLHLLVDGLSSAGNLPQAVEYARRYLAVNNLAEDIHRRLIEMYAAAGERSAALRQYEDCCMVLERELGVRPSPETVAAYLYARDPVRTGASLPASSAAINFLPSLHVPLVGRRPALEALEQALLQAREGRGQVVIVLGEPGIGKSRLLHEFTARPHPRTRTLTAAASRECCAIPYQPLVDALRPALSSAGLRESLPAAWAAEALPLFPELADASTPIRLPAPVGTDQARLRLFDALLSLLLALTEAGCCAVLCLDDLQWADATTLDWLAYTASRIRSRRVLLVLTCRKGEDECLADLMEALGRLGNARQLHLHGLEFPDVLRMVASLGGQLPVNDQQVEQLYRRTGGNPFFLLEIVREALEAGTQPGGALTLPATVQAAISGRMNRLQPRARQVAEAASVLGPGFSFDQVRLTSGREELEILDALDELVARQFLLEAAAGYQFTHEIIREAVYAGLSHWRRRKLHGRAGRALEKLKSSDWTAIAWQFEGAGEPGRAARYLLRAGQAAKAVFAHAEARADFEHALDLLEQEALSPLEGAALEQNRRTRCELLFERGWVLRLLGEMEAYTQDLEQVAALAQELGDVQALRRLHWQEAYNHRYFCRYAEAQAAARRGLRLSREAGDVHMEAQCLRELGMSARERGDYPLAEESLELALELFLGKAADSLQAVHTLGNLSTLHCRRGEPDQAIELARRALELCERAGLPYDRRIPLGDAGAALAAQGKYAEAEPPLRESLEIAREIADRSQEIYCLGHLGRVELGRGNFAAALQLLEEALRLAEQVGSAGEQSWLHTGLAQTLAGLGDLECAQAHAEKALALACSLGRETDQRIAEELLSRLR